MYKIKGKSMNKDILEHNFLMKKRTESTRLYCLRNIAEMHFEVARNCNIECLYCYSSRESSSRNLLMPLKTACKYIDIIFENSKSKNIEIVFHGGEPLLQITNWFYNVIEYAIRSANLCRKNLRFVMQSNCILLNEEKLNLIKKYHIIVGTSLDGPPKINNLTRKKGEIVLKNIKKLNKINCFGGVICVVNAFNYDKMKEIMSFFENKGIFKTKIVIGHSVGKSKRLPNLSHDMIFTAYKSIYEYLSKKSLGRNIIEAHVAQKLSRFLTPPTSEDFKDILICAHPFCGGGITTIFSDTEGNLYPCGSSVCNLKTTLGNINSINDKTYLSSIVNFHRKENKYFKICAKCVAARICNFGCPAFDSIDKETYKAECIANQLFYRYLNNKNTSEIKEIITNLRANVYGKK